MLGEGFLFWLCFKPRIWPQCWGRCHVKREILLGFTAQVQTPFPTPAHTATSGSPCWPSTQGARGGGSSGMGGFLRGFVKTWFQSSWGYTGVPRVPGRSSPFPARLAQASPPRWGSPAITLPSVYPLDDVPRGRWLWVVGHRCVWGTHFIPTVFILCLKAGAGYRAAGSRPLLCECGAAVRQAVGLGSPFPALAPTEASSDCLSVCSLQFLSLLALRTAWLLEYTNFLHVPSAL